MYQWMIEPERQTGPQSFPRSYNLCCAELETTGKNSSSSLFYGHSAFTDALKRVQDACQTILDKPRP
jgi:hypothetical protein